MILILKMDEAETDDDGAERLDKGIPIRFVRLPGQTDRMKLIFATEILRACCPERNVIGYFSEHNSHIAVGHTEPLSDFIDAVGVEGYITGRPGGFRFHPRNLAWIRGELASVVANAKAALKEARKVPGRKRELSYATEHYNSQRDAFGRLYPSR